MTRDDLLELDANWLDWLQQWDRMLTAYQPQRPYRTRLLFDLPAWPRDAPIRAVDLGAGPGSTAFRGVERYPRAHITCVEADPVLVAMGTHAARRAGLDQRIEFLWTDLREPDWWSTYTGEIDLVFSSTALHWLSAEAHAEVYRRAFGLLRPGGWLINSDHIASDQPALQHVYEQMLRRTQEVGFAREEALTWGEYWGRLADELGITDLDAVRGQDALWQGSDTGQPKHFHREVLESVGFDAVEFVWQDLGEAIISARKPAQ